MTASNFSVGFGGLDERGDHKQETVIKRVRKSCLIAPIICVMSVHTSVCLCECISAAPTERIFVKFGDF